MLICSASPRGGGTPTSIVVASSQVSVIYSELSQMICCVPVCAPASGMHTLSRTHPYVLIQEPALVGEISRKSQQFLLALAPGIAKDLSMLISANINYSFCVWLSTRLHVCRVEHGLGPQSVADA